jgi:acetyltransferase-like isoleucine patch superfamily enzyme
MLDDCIQYGDGSYIKAPKIDIADTPAVGKNVRIVSRQPITIGKRCRFGDNVDINVERLTIGDDFFHYEPGLRIGGGGSNFPDAIIEIGSRCVMHNNYINVAKPVIIGDDVGLSPDVQIITHGFWNNPLKGHPYKYGPVTIGNGTIVGQRSMILPGVTIPPHSVIGAQSTVTKTLMIPHTIYAGNPAKEIRQLERPTMEQQNEFIWMVITEFSKLYKRQTGKDVSIEFNAYPWLSLDGYFRVNLEEGTYAGDENEVTDAFRDFLRRYGVRVYTKRPFGNVMELS